MYVHMLYYKYSKGRSYEYRGKTGKEVQMEIMTDKQMEVILNLVADKFSNCKDMEEVKKAVQEVRDMAKKDKSND